MIVQQLKNLITDSPEFLWAGSNVPLFTFHLQLLGGKLAFIIDYKVEFL